MVKENGAQTLVQLIEQNKGDPEKLAYCLQLLKNLCRIGKVLLIKIMEDASAKTILVSIPHICELVLQITQQNALNKVVLKPAVSLLKLLLSVDGDYFVISFLMTQKICALCYRLKETC